ncbi:MAG: hypothetical protein LBF76_03645 [Holosporales bacterium]|nr:hypothetical protein [Holosporales bacterium]
MTIKDSLWKGLHTVLNVGCAKVLILEISGLCSARCKYCCRGTSNHISTIKFMTAAHFEALLAHLKKTRFLPRWRGMIELYSWSEPTLNPEIDTILQITHRYKQRARLSSNFIVPWRIAPESYPYIGNVIFSLCSLQNEHYRRIYGADLQTTLAHFKEFLANRKKYNPGMSVTIHWLQYKFNTEETAAAKQYFSELLQGEFCFRGFPAYLNDLQAHLSYFRSGGQVLEGYNLEEVKEDIDLDRIIRISTKAPKSFPCPMKTPSFLVITEDGQLAQCCMVTSKHPEYRRGDILTLRRQEIIRLKKNAPICQECEQCHFPYFFFGGNEGVD